ncbi:ATP-binding cassette domain-containing protein [Ruminococcaceae bacterium OttesenSCG-928-L11]|nr:ATP-binding cassette domain-containing protein [Ruminococcaceae bacterium OttesenSCG-928-L11]
MLDITGASKTFLQGTVNEHVALNRLDLHLDAGEFVTIVGSNGAGKSTLFNAIGGTFYLDSGRISLESRDITYLTEHKRAAFIGRIFQDPVKGTAPDMTIEENLSLAYNRRKLFGLNMGVQKKDVVFFREQLSQFGMGLEDRMKHKVGLLSGGQRQALTLLMATIAGPRLLLLDEHTAALDPAAAEKVMAITRDIVSREKLTTMMITHNIRSALRTGTRTIMLEDGKVILDISGKEREEMTVSRLMELYSHKANKTLDNDRMLLTKDENGQ